MLNSAYADTGVQLRWVAPTIVFIEIGAELMRGDSFPAADGAARHALRVIRGRFLNQFLVSD